MHIHILFDLRRIHSLTTTTSECERKRERKEFLFRPSRLECVALAVLYADTKE